MIESKNYLHVEQAVDKTFGGKLEDTRNVSDQSSLPLWSTETERSAYRRFRIRSFSCEYEKPKILITTISTLSPDIKFKSIN